jgi:hypothetical protein
MSDRTSADLIGDILEIIAEELDDESYNMRQHLLRRVWERSFGLDFAQEDVHQEQLLKYYNLWEDD